MKEKTVQQLVEDTNYCFYNCSQGKIEWDEYVERLEEDHCIFKLDAPLKDRKEFISFLKLYHVPVSEYYFDAVGGLYFRVHNNLSKEVR